MPIGQRISYGGAFTLEKGRHVINPMRVMQGEAAFKASAHLVRDITDDKKAICHWLVSIRLSPPLLRITTVPAPGPASWHYMVAPICQGTNS